jgi:endogenous inhibitor of DNA gyrase (YacG/DUF329 family)
MGDMQKCVVCRTRPIDPRWRPFCSERCRISDLGAWATESYRIPAKPGEEDGAQPDDPADRLK